VDVAGYISALDRDGVLLADAAAEAGLTADIPACPRWQVRDLVRHMAYVHGWATRHVKEQLAEFIDGATEEEILNGGPPDSELIAAYREGHAALVRTLRDANPAVQCATFIAAPSPLAFWARRQAHETAIHRYDAQAARPAGPPPPADAFQPAFASDGVDELIMGFAARRRYRPHGEGERSLAVAATDTGGRWHARLADGGTEVSRGDRQADCVLEGPAAGLYAFLWNRCDSAPAARVTISGDPAILNIWGSSVRVRWS
jgi:uncharacterized protein (TIGR03083 family)